MIKGASGPSSAAVRHEQLRRKLGEAIEQSRRNPTKKHRALQTPAGIPKTIDRFELLHELGRGGMGDVYFARDGRLGREVAIKLLRSRDELARARFERGARAMARLSHPNVVSLHEIGDAEGLSYIVMEFVEGPTLQAWLESRERPLPEIVSTFMAAGEGLHAAHESGLVHRDFKPSNVLLANDGRVLVTDFGLARGGPSSATGADEDLSKELRMAGLLTGTPAYMAPEQFSGDEVDPRTDQFAFCVALWEAVYGERPFRAPNIQTLAAVIHEDRPEPPEGARAPKWLRKALVRGLAVKPERRWPSQRALLDALAAGLGRPRWLAWLG